MTDQDSVGILDKISNTASNLHDFIVNSALLMQFQASWGITEKYFSISYYIIKYNIVLL